MNLLSDQSPKQVLLYKRPDHIEDLNLDLVMVAITKLPPGKYRLWGYDTGQEISALIGYRGKYDWLLAAIKELEAEGVVRKVNKNGEATRTGPYWEIHGS